MTSTRKDYRLTRRNDGTLRLQQRGDDGWYWETATPASHESAKEIVRMRRERRASIFHPLSEAERALAN